MVNNPAGILIFATPALASLAVASAAWWAKPGRGTLRAGGAAAISVGRAAATRWIPAAVGALICLTLGVLAYTGHAPEVSRSQALHGAAIALWPAPWR